MEPCEIYFREIRPALHDLGQPWQGDRRWQQTAALLAAPDHPSSFAIHQTLPDYQRLLLCLQRRAR